MSRLSLLYWLGLIVRSDWLGLIISWLYSSGFRGCAPVGFCGCAPVSFVVVRSNSWWSESGFVEVWWVWGCGFVEDGRSEHGGGWLWVCGGGAVGLGLWRWAFVLWVWDYGSVVVGLGLWRWGTRTMMCVCFRQKSRKESRWVCFRWKRRIESKEKDKKK